MATAMSYSSIPEVFRTTAKQRADQTAIIFMGREVSFGQIDQQSDRVAAGLAARGIAKGDHVALYCVNCDIFAAAYLGILKAGAIVVPLNLLLTPKELEYIINDAECKALIYHEAFADNVSAFRAAATRLDFCVAIGAKQSAADDLAWPALLANEAAVPAPMFDAAQDVASVLYTSGTTGKPKGAMLTHRNLLADTAGVVKAIKIHPGEDRLLVVLPMFHAFAATVGMLTPLLYGATLVPVPKFEPDLVMNTIAQTQATIFLGVPSMYNVLLNLSDEQVAKFASIRFGISGGAAMPQELLKRFEQRYGKFIYEGDGPTECGPVTCVNPIDGVRKHASVGLPIPGVEMSIRDLQGIEVADNEIAEICVRGDNVMKGYFKRPDDTRESFWPEGWFRTGDLGYRDADGYFYIVDRIKDMVIVNGMNVYPRVVEEVLYEHPDIREAAVIGEPHESHGEIPVAYVSLQPGKEINATDIKTFCRDRLGRHQIPRRIHFLAELPKNAAGKILKRELRKHGELERGIDSREEA
ncbi:MAG: long-chain fatty acid--CoA ligase [Gammaproteobacteria bacterium]|nr:long-chain fatty acid--CoA ligase [Gammaproteobacteria bacterium]